MEEIPVKHTVLFFVMFITSIHCMIRTINVIEGDIAFLNFTYSCSSTKVTLQRGSVYIYNSKSLISWASSNLKFRNETDGETCFLYLTINPVTRDDQGGYVLFAYKYDPTLYEDDRIQLFVSYPPGKASCSFCEEHIDPDWVRLQCTAPLGNIGGFIMCYQNGSEISSLDSQKHDGILSQTLLAKVGDLVYCCSCIVGQTKDRCACKDSVWDPIQNKKVTNVTDPCPPAVTTVQHPPFSLQPTEEDEFELTSPSTETSTVSPQQKNSGKAFFGLIVIICVLILGIVVIGVKYYRKTYPKKLPNVKAENHAEESSFVDMVDAEWKKCLTRSKTI